MQQSLHSVANIAIIHTIEPLEHTLQPPEDTFFGCGHLYVYNGKYTTCSKRPMQTISTNWRGQSYHSTSIANTLLKGKSTTNLTYFSANNNLKGKDKIFTTPPYLVG
jgi:hypothetical protein